MISFLRKKAAAVCAVLSIILFAFGCGIKPDGVLSEKKTAEEIFPSVAPSVAVVKTDYNQGSGFVARVEDGKMYVVTNKHVFEGGISLLGENAKLEFFGGKKAEGKLIGYDSYHDIAVIAADAFDSDTPAALTFSDGELSYAQSAFIIGNALGQGLGAYDGIVSMPDRKLDNNGKTIPVVQTTIPINSGCSGGPVFDLQGGVIGVGTYQTCFDPIDTDRPVDGISYFVSGFLVKEIVRQAVAENPAAQKSASELFKIDCTLGADGVINFTGLGFSGKAGENGITVTNSSLEYGNEKLSEGDVVTHIGSEFLGGKSVSDIMSVVMRYLGKELMPQVSDWGELITVKFKRGDIERTVYRQGVYEKNY